MIFIISWLIGLVVGAITTILNPEMRSIQTIASNLLFYQLTITLTLVGIQGFIGHFFKSDTIADFIGWAKGSPFQKELGCAQLGYAIAGILCIWIRDGFWLATIVIVSPLYLGAAFVHVKEMIKNKNFKPGNSVILIPDIIIAVSLIVLYVFAAT